jgi:hypothetical protein
MDGEIGIIWQGKVKNGRQTAYSRIMTSVPNVLKVLEEVNLNPEVFNGMITGVASSKFLPCTLFVKGHEFGAVLSALKAEGLCSDYKAG